MVEYVWYLVTLEDNKNGDTSHMIWFRMIGDEVYVFENSLPKHFPKEIARGKKGTVVIWECAGITCMSHKKLYRKWKERQLNVEISARYRHSN